MISYERYASFSWGSYVRIVVQMSELLFKCWNCGSTPQSEQYNHLDGQWSLLIWFHYYFLSEPQSWHLNHNSDIWSSPTKMASFKPQKSRNGGQKKDIPRIHADMDFLQKTGPKLVKFGLRGPICILHPPIEGYHPVPCLSTQITERQGTAMY